LKSIIFICLGNICRSPLAEGVAKVKAKELGLNIKVDSAGLSTCHNGENPCPISLNLAKKHGIDISNIISQHISEFSLDSYTLVVALDESNKEELKRVGINAKKLGDFGFEGRDVADLYYEPYRGNEVWEMIDRGVLNILKSLQ